MNVIFIHMTPLRGPEAYVLADNDPIKETLWGWSGGTVSMCAIILKVISLVIILHRLGTVL